MSGSFLDRRRRCLGTLAGLALLAARPATAAGLPERFDPRRDAAVDLAQALVLARETRRRVMIDVGGEWCTWCHIMDRFFARHEDLRRLRDSAFVWLKVNYSPENRNAAVLGRWPAVTGYPHLFVLETDGTLLHSQDTSKLEARRDYDSRAFQSFLARWAPPR